MRDDGEAARVRVEEALEAVEAVEVEVVRRLVEQQHVEAGEQDRGEAGSRSLTARERRRLLLERHREPQVGTECSRPRLEVAAAKRGEALQGCRVGVGVPVARVQLERLLSLRHARAAREVGEQRLAGAAVVLLRQVADGEARRIAIDTTLVRLLQPSEEAQQRRLARAVAPDEAEPRVRPERQVGLVENGMGAERLDDADERDPHGGTSGDGTRTGAAVAAGVNVCGSSSPSWACAEAPCPS